MSFITPETFKRKLPPSYYDLLTSPYKFSRFDGEKLYYCPPDVEFLGLNMTEAAFSKLFDQFYERRKPLIEDRRTISDTPLITYTIKSASSEFMFDFYDINWRGFTFLLSDFSEHIHNEDVFQAWIPDLDEYRNMLLLFKLTWIGG